MSGLSPYVVRYLEQSEGSRILKIAVLEVSLEDGISPQDEIDLVTGLAIAEFGEGVIGVERDRGSRLRDEYE